jgi:hypothetical protein
MIGDDLPQARVARASMIFICREQAPTGGPRAGDGNMPAATLTHNPWKRIWKAGQM